MSNNRNHSTNGTRDTLDEDNTQGYAPIIPKSVNDTENETQLRSALNHCDLDHASDPSHCWMLPPDSLEAGSLAQVTDEELMRLQVLQSYLILDSEREQRFERITALVGRIFQVPIALISLVDLGRQWFMSNRGLGEVRETPRNVAFCSHAILSTQDLLVVPDATLDARFQNNPLVTGEPFIRFYAGAPLISPEGFKLGTLCIIDVKPRPDGLSLYEKQNLREMAALVMDTMVYRRKERARYTSSKSVEIACTAHDLLTPLSGVQLSLSLLQDDGELISRMDEHQKELLQTASNCGDIMSRICNDTIESFRNDIIKKNSLSSDSDNDNELFKPDKDSGKDGYLIIASLVENLSKVMDPFPKRVPLTISVDESVPPVVKGDGLKVFRAALNYLTNACKHTEVGSVNFRILTKERKSGMKELLFEAEDTGSGIDVELYSKLFVPFTEDPSQTKFGQEHADMTHSGLGLFSVASIISSIGGDYGFRPRLINRDHSDNETATSASGYPTVTSGSIFWFSFPLVVPENMNDIMNAYIQKVERIKSIESISSSMQNIISSQPKHDNSSNVNDFTEVCHRQDMNDQDDENMPAKKKQKVLSAVGMSRTECNDLYKNLSKPLVAGGDVAAGSDLTHGDESSSPGITKSKRTRHALVIDDSITIRKSIERALVKMGFAVSLATNGMEGLKSLQKSLFDVVLCDFLMPIMDGLDCVQQYRSWENRNRPWFHQVIIGISAHASQQDAARGADVGMDRFIAKPLPLKTLKNLVTLPEVTKASQALDKKYADATQDTVDSSKPMLPPDLQLPSKKVYSKSNDDDESDNQSEISSISGMDSISTGLVCLIAEDSRSVTRTLVRAVEMRGWRASVVDNGEAALRLMKMRNWDAVFLDEQMPLLSGTSCLSCFRQWETQNRVARQNNIYLVSGNTQSTFPPGFDGSLVKPIDIEALRKALDKASIKLKGQILTR